MMDDARALLDCVLPPMRAGETVEGRYLLPGQPPERRFYPDASYLLRDVGRAWRTQRHCYFGIALRLGRRGDAAHISRAGALWCEVDYKLWSALPDPAAAALEAVTDFPLTPSACVFTGGGLHAYWCLTEPCDVQANGKEGLERVNAALGRAVAGQGRAPDHTQDAARIYRLPDTLNFKYQPPTVARLVWCEPQRRYALAEVEHWLGVAYPWAMRPEQPQRVALAWGTATGRPRDLRERAALGRIRRDTLSLLDCAGPAGYQSASEADAALAAGLASAGLSAAEVYIVLRDSTRGGDALRRKGERHGEHYLKTTAQRAAAFVGPVTAIPDPARERASARNTDDLLRRRLAAGSVR